MRVLLGAIVVAALAAPALADDFEETLEAALEAYRAGDIAGAQDELDFARSMLGELKAQGLATFLPPAPEGWTREIADGAANPLAMLGGGTGVTAEYSGDTGALEITMMADSPMVAGLGAMFANPSLMAMQGEVRRVGRQRYVVAGDGEITAMVANRILVQLSGDAPRETKIALFESIDFAGLGDF